MLFNFEQLLAFVSRSETIHPGEILLSGCVGNGSGMEIGRYPVRGDTIELEITPIGRLSTRIV
jgi:2-keto-4-pentenoate hydratase/2-oxohepta-3-ene-1,7-dioic acid hydratase in catechol pathway